VRVRTGPNKVLGWGGQTCPRKAEPYQCGGEVGHMKAREKTSEKQPAQKKKKAIKKMAG